MVTTSAEVKQSRAVIMVQMPALLHKHRTTTLLHLSASSTSIAWQAFVIPVYVPDIVDAWPAAKRPKPQMYL